MLQPVLSHPWNLSPEDATALQQSWCERVITEDRFDAIRYVAGIDVQYHSETDDLVAGVVVLDMHAAEKGGFAVVEQVTHRDKVSFPYVPGLFSFRELPPVVAALQKLTQVPDLLVCDGQGLAHPRRFGLACHLGVLFDKPCMGVSKTRLLGEHEELASQRGAYQWLLDQQQCIGAVVRTQTDIKPLFVSAGHRISLMTAIDWTLTLSPRYRLPETTRQADQLVRRTMSQASA